MENFLAQNSLYLVFFIVLIIWFGILTFLFVLDNKLKKVESKVKIFLEKK